MAGEQLLSEPVFDYTRELLLSGNSGAVREDSPLFKKLVERVVLVEDDRDEVQELIQESRRIDEENATTRHKTTTVVLTDIPKRILTA